MTKILIIILSYILILFNSNLNADDNINNLKIGLLAPFSGDNKELGDSLLLSSQLALNEINDNRIMIIPADSGTNNPTKINIAINEFVEAGAKIIIGGKMHSLGGNFYQPTILSNVTSKAKITYEETFGPVAPIYKFTSEDEVIKMANDTPYGLASYFYSRDIGRVWRVSEALEYGMVGVNTGLTSKAEIPFGGIKESGLGREGSKYGLDEYLEIKYINMAGI